MFFRNSSFRPGHRDPVTPLPHFAKPDIPEDQAKLLQNIYDAVCKNLDRETFLLNFRISWAIALSAGIIGTQAFILSYLKDQYPNRPSVALLVHGALTVLSIIAAQFCYMSARGVVAAQSQTAEVKEAYERYKLLFDELRLPRPFGDRETHQTGDYNAIAFPKALMRIWLAFVVVQCLHLAFLLIKLPEDATLRVCARSATKCMERMHLLLWS